MLLIILLLFFHYEIITTFLNGPQFIYYVIINKDLKQQCLASCMAVVSLFSLNIQIKRIFQSTC